MKLDKKNDKHVFPVKDRLDKLEERADFMEDEIKKCISDPDGFVKKMLDDQKNLNEMTFAHFDQIKKHTVIIASHQASINELKSTVYDHEKRLSKQENCQTDRKK